MGGCFPAQVPRPVAQHSAGHAHCIFCSSSASAALLLAVAFPHTQIGQRNISAAALPQAAVLSAHPKNQDPHSDSDHSSTNEGEKWATRSLRHLHVAAGPDKPGAVYPQKTDSSIGAKICLKEPHPAFPSPPEEPAAQQQGRADHLPLTGSMSRWRLQPFPSEPTDTGFYRLGFFRTRKPHCLQELWPGGGPCCQSGCQHCLQCFIWGTWQIAAVLMEYWGKRDQSPEAK